MTLPSLKKRYDAFCKDAEQLLKSAGLLDPTDEPKIIGKAFLEACNSLAAIHFPDDREVNGKGPRGLIWGMYPAVTSSSIDMPDPDPVNGARSVAETVKHIMKHRPPLDKEEQSLRERRAAWLRRCPFFEADRKYQLLSHMVFVLMPFTEEWSDRIWRHIREYMALKVDGTQIEVRRADDMFGQGVMEDVFEGIARSNLIIAECTGRNPNVLYELGISHAIGKRTILLSQNKDDIPFDLGRFRFCIYNDNSDGHDSLRHFLRESVREVYGEFV